MSYLTLNNYNIFLNTTKLFCQMSAYKDNKYILFALEQNLIEAILPGIRDKNLIKLQKEVYYLLSNIAADSGLPEYQ